MVLSDVVVSPTIAQAESKFASSGQHEVDGWKPLPVPIDHEVLRSPVGATPATVRPKESGVSSGDAYIDDFAADSSQSGTVDPSQAQIGSLMDTSAYLDVISKQPSQEPTVQNLLGEDNLRGRELFLLAGTEAIDTVPLPDRACANDAHLRSEINGQHDDPRQCDGVEGLSTLSDSRYARTSRLKALHSLQATSTL
jgi:hypothetical protein